MNTIQLTIKEINNQINETRTLRMSLQPHQTVLDNLLHSHMVKLYEDLATLEDNTSSSL